MSNRAARTEVFELGLDPKQAHSPQQLEEARKLVCVEETPLDATHDVLETCVVHDNESLLAIHDPIDHTAIREGEIVDKEEEKLKQKEEEVSKTVSLETKTDLLEEVSSSATKEEEKPVVVEETPKPRKRSKKSEE